MKTVPIDLVDVREIAPAAQRVVAQFERDFSGVLGRAELHHIGATALPFGHTKGDVDVNVRVAESDFPLMVAALAERLSVAQPENWSGTFASFFTDAYALPLGVQVTSIDSEDDFLLALRDRLRADLALLRRYDETKVAAASDGAEAYWQAKNDLLRRSSPSSSSHTHARSAGPLRQLYAVAEWVAAHEPRPSHDLDSVGNFRSGCFQPPAQAIEALVDSQAKMLPARRRFLRLEEVKLETFADDEPDELRRIELRRNGALLEVKKSRVEGTRRLVRALRHRNRHVL